jgi:hypothetical protein
MPQTMITGGFLYLTAKLSPAGSSFVGDRDLGITKGRLKMRDPNNPDSTYTEWIEFGSVTAVGDGNFTYGSLVRQLSQVSDPAVSLGTGNTWVAGTEAKLVAMHDQLADRLNGVLVPVYATTVARDAAITAPVNGMSCYVTADGVFYDYQGGAWATRGNSATANASTTVAGKVEIATQVEVDAGTDTGGTGATVAVIPSTFQTGITNRTAMVAEAQAGTSITKLMTPLSTRTSLVDYGDGSDGDVTITTGVTLTRDMFYNNLAVNSPGVLDPAGYKVFVLGTLSGNGTIRRNGANGGNAAGTTGGTAGSVLATGTLGACSAGVAGGNGGTTGGGGNGTATTGAAALVNSFKTGTPFGGGGAGGKGNLSTGGGGGFNASANTGFFVGRTFSSLFRFVPLGYSTAMTYPVLPGGIGGGGGGTYYSTSTGGAGGGGGSSGGYIFIAAQTVSFSGTIQANGGTGGNASNSTAAVGGCSGGGGGGGGGSAGTLYCVSNSFTFSGTLNLNGGNAGNGTNATENGSGGGTSVGGGGGQGGEGGIFILSAVSYSLAGSTITLTAGTGGTAGAGAGGGAAGAAGANGGAGAQYLLTI